MTDREFLIAHAVLNHLTDTFGWGFEGDWQPRKCESCGNEDPVGFYLITDGASLRDALRWFEEFSTPNARRDELLRIGAGVTIKQALELLRLCGITGPTRKAAIEDCVEFDVVQEIFAACAAVTAGLGAPPPPDASKPK